MKNITTLFYCKPKYISKGLARMDEEDSNHIARVLRYKTGDRFILTDGQGNAWWAELERVDKKRCLGRLLPDEKIPHLSGELPADITCAVGVIRPNRFEHLLSAIVQLGTNRIVPLKCRYSDPGHIKRMSADDYNSRLKKITISGMKNSLRTVLPQMDSPLELEELFREKWDIIIFGDPDGLPFLRIKDELEQKRILLLTGPEGGFSVREIEMIRDMDGLPLSLGRTRLRTETAAQAIMVKALSGLGMM